MKTIKHLIFSALLLCAVGNSLYAQEDGSKVYLGVGVGLDYGGLGAKLEVLPVKYVGVFGGAVKILPDKKVSPNLMIMYGYNAVFKGTDFYSKQYNMTSYGVTAGVNLDIKLGRKGHKLSTGLFIPFRSEKFKDNYDAAKNDPNIAISSELLPFTLGVGFNFAL